MSIAVVSAGVWAAAAAIVLAAGAVALVRAVRRDRNGRPGNGAENHPRDSRALPGSFHEMVQLAGNAASSEFAAALFLRRLAELASLSVAAGDGISLARAKGLVAKGQWRAPPRVRELLKSGRRPMRFNSTEEINAFVDLFEKAVTGYGNEQ